MFKRKNLSDMMAHNVAQKFPLSKTKCLMNWEWKKFYKIFAKFL